MDSLLLISFILGANNWNTCLIQSYWCWNQNRCCPEALPRQTQYPCSWCEVKEKTHGMGHKNNNKKTQLFSMWSAMIWKPLQPLIELCHHVFFAFSLWFSSVVHSHGSSQLFCSSGFPFFFLSMMMYRRKFLSEFLRLSARYRRQRKQLWLVILYKRQWSFPA